MSGGGGDKPEPTPVSKGERIQTQLAKDQYAYYKGTYAPIAKDMADAASQDFSNRAAGQASSASMRAGSPTLQAVASSGSMMDSNTLADAMTTARMSGKQAGLQQRDTQRFEALGVGLGATADATNTLSRAGNIQTDAAIQNTKLSLANSQSDADTKNALYGAAGSVAAMYGTKAGLDWYGKKQAFKEDFKPTQDVINAQAKHWGSGYGS